SLRFFDVTDQRSIENTEEAVILPATDFIAFPAELTQAADLVEKGYQKRLKQLTTPDDKQRLTGNFETVLADLRKGQLSDAYHVFASQIFPQQTGILDYLGKDGLVVFDDYSRLLEQENDLQQQNAEWITDKLKQQSVLPETQLGVEVRQRQK